MRELLVGPKKGLVPISIARNASIRADIRIANFTLMDKCWVRGLMHAGSPHKIKTSLSFSSYLQDLTAVNKRRKPADFTCNNTQDQFFFLQSHNVNHLTQENFDQSIVKCEA